MMRQNDELELWRMACTGDAEAFGQLFDRHANAVYRFCFRGTADWSLAEDLTSIVFLEAWRKRRRVEIGERGVLPWLLGVAVNVTRNERRSSRRYRSALAGIPALDQERDFADDASARIDAQREAERTLARLKSFPRREREVMALLAADLTTGEIAMALRISETTVRTCIHRLRRRLALVGSAGEPSRPLEEVTS